MTNPIMVPHNCPVEGQMMIEAGKPCNWCFELDSALTPEYSANPFYISDNGYRIIQSIRIQELEAALAQWATWGTIEIAIRNPAVAESMRHWEGRAEKAEAALAERNKLLRTIHACGFFRDEVSALIDAAMKEKP